MVRAAGAAACGIRGLALRCIGDIQNCTIARLVSAGQAVEELYRIGAVAKRTGISPECLRAWERRYGLEPADRAGRTRFYSRAQVDRLIAVKALLDQGHPVSRVIRLDDDELRRRLEGADDRPPVLAEPRVGLVGGQLLLARRQATDLGVRIVAEWASAADLTADRDALPELDCVVVYVPTLDPESIEIIEEILPSVRLVVAFKYATSVDLERCRSEGRALLRWPADWTTLERRVLAATPRRPPGPRYSDEQLVHIALMASRASCDCPRHLVELVTAVNDYAAHARRCASDGEHRALDESLSAARTALEDSLRAFVEEHGLLATAN